MLYPKLKVYILSLLSVLLCKFAFAYDDKTIVITKDTDSMPNIQVISLNDFIDTTNVYKMLLQDLRVISHFNIFYDDSLHVDAINTPLVMQNLKDKGINLLAQVVSRIENGSVIAMLSLYDFTQDKAYNVEYKEDDPNKYPFISHSMALYINNHIKAVPIDWINRYIVFATSSGLDSGGSDIFISDYTFTYQKRIIQGGLNVFPKWANSDQRSFYYTVISDNATIYRYDLSNANSTKILSSPGMAVVSDVSSDGKKLLVSMSPSGLSDVFLYEADSKKLTQLTTYSGIDVNGHFLNNDSSFAFVSDRLGYPNIFVQDLSKDAMAYQLVYMGRYNNSISTFQNYVVYSSRESSDSGANAFNLYLASFSSDYIRQLSATGFNKAPNFSRDGDSIMYIRRVNAEDALGIIRLSVNKSFLFPLKKLSIQSFDW